MRRCGDHACSHKQRDEYADHHGTLASKVKYLNRMQGFIMYEVAFKDSTNMIDLGVLRRLYALADE